jgi:hypothetical protein
MRVSILAAAAACLIAMPATAGELRPQSTELSSQGVTIEGPGVDVRVGPERRRWQEREVRGGGGCKTITVRETMPDGSSVTRTRTRC